MCIEIEAKLKVDSPQRIIKKLGLLGAQFLQEQLHTDYYFDNADSAMITSDSCLRLRLSRTGDSEKIFLTYKGARQKGQFKKRQEIEIEVGDADLTEKLLSALGYEKKLVIEKKRQTWRVGECEVAVDKLPLLGYFVEIEGPDENKIADVQKSLGLSDLPHIPQSYAALTAEKLSQREV